MSGLKEDKEPGFLPKPIIKVLLGPSRSPAAAGAREHGKDLAIYLHNSCAGAAGSPAQSPHRAVRHMKPGAPRAHLPNAIRALQSQGGLQQVGALYGARRHQRETLTVLGWTCTPELHLPEAWSQHGVWAEWQGLGRGLPHLKRHFQHYLTLSTLTEQAIGVKWGMGL